MFNKFDKDKGIIFGLGAVAGIALVKILKTKTVRDMAVKSLAQGIIAKDKIAEEVANIREEADDICAEAKLAARKGCCDETCDCECEEECDETCDCGCQEEK